MTHQSLQCHQDGERGDGEAGEKREGKAEVFSVPDVVFVLGWFIGGVVLAFVRLLCFVFFWGAQQG